MDILFGPYGCLLSRLGISSNPEEVKHQGIKLYQNAVETIAKEYLKAGATLPTVNAFFLRTLLNRASEDLYKEFLGINLEALLKAMGYSIFKRIAICLGPAEDCYKPELAPNVAEARLFAKRQYKLCLEVLHDYGVPISQVVFLHETIGTAREAFGISQAAKSLDLPLILSFVVDREGRLLDGQSIQETISLIDRETAGFVEGFSLNCCSPFAFEKAVVSRKRLIGFYPNSWDANPACYEQGETPVEPDKNHSLELIAEIGRRYHLRFIGGCCGFGYGDIRRLFLIG
jgi:S-methylmethionine-dependent homocysteine/selenocysteine methylase